MSASRSSTINTLASELLTHIISFLPWQDHFTISRVCRLWHSIIFSSPIQSNRYMPLDPETTPCPRMHNLFTDVGLECIVNVSTGQVSKILFIQNETEEILSQQDLEEATVDLTNHGIIKDPLLHFQGWRYETNIRREEWDMGACIMWNQRGYEFGSRNDRQFYRQDWFRFVVGEEEGANDIMQREVNLDISVEEFINVLARHVLKFDALKIPGQPEMKLRLGMYTRMGVVVVRNVHEDSRVFDLSSKPFEHISATMDRTSLDYD